MRKEIYDFTVVGAGVAGLYAANQLSKQGFRILLLEQAPEVKEIGAGLSLWGMGLSAMREIDLLETVLSKSNNWETYDQWRMQKKVSSHLTKGLSLDPSLSPVVMERGVLQFILLDALPKAVDLKCDHEVVSVKTINDVCEVTNTNGETYRSRYVIGADGIDSCVRKSMFGAASLKYNGYVCHRGVCDNHIDLDDSVGLEIFGKKGLRLGCFPLPKNELYWFTFANSKTQKVAFDTIRGDLTKLHPIAAKLADLIKSKNVMETPIFSTPPYRERASSDRGVLIGDAACTMQPSLGVGSSMALNDAFVLCDLINHNPENIRPTISQYYRQQFPKWRKFSRMNNHLGFLGQFSGQIGLSVMLYLSNIGFSSGKFRL